LRAHFAELAKDCLIQPHHPPINICGGYKFPDAPAIELTSPAPADIDGVPSVQIADDLAIPESLRRAGGER
jgi:hypothetical protein